MRMTAEEIEQARRLALPAEFEGQTTHRAPATAVALGRALDAIEHLQAFPPAFPPGLYLVRTRAKPDTVRAAFESEHDANEWAGREFGDPERTIDGSGWTVAPSFTPAKMLTFERPHPTQGSKPTPPHHGKPGYGPTTPSDPP